MQTSNIYAFIGQDTSNNFHKAIDWLIKNSPAPDVVQSSQNLRSKLHELEQNRLAGTITDNDYCIARNNISSLLIQLSPPECKSNIGWTIQDFEKSLSIIQMGDLLVALNHAIAINNLAEFQGLFIQLKCQIIDQPSINPNLELAKNGKSTFHNRIALSIFRILADIRKRIEYMQSGVFDFTVPKQYQTLLKSLSEEDIEKIAEKQGNLTACHQITKKNDVRVASLLMEFKEEYVHYQMLKFHAKDIAVIQDLDKRYKQYLLYRIISIKNPYQADRREAFLKEIKLPAIVLSNFENMTNQQLRGLAEKNNNLRAFDILIQHEGFNLAVPLLKQERLYHEYNEVTKSKYSDFDLDSISFLSAFEQFLIAKACFPEAF